MNRRIQGFRGEYLWELDIVETQLTALAEAVPAEKYAWRPVADSRTFSQVLVHVAASNFMLLRVVGVIAPGGFDLYGKLEGDRAAQFIAAIRKNMSLEETMVQKRPVMELLARSFAAVRESLTTASDEAIEKSGQFFSEPSTVRRVYLRILVHLHEHMGQAVVYTRAMGIKLPWPDPLKELERMVAEGRAREF